MTPEPAEKQNELHEWVVEHGDYLYRYCIKHFYDSSLAEDLIQDTLLAAVTARERFQGGSSVRTWLTGILRHKMIDRMRSTASRPTVSADELGDDQLSRYFDQHDHWRPETGPIHWTLNPEQLFEKKAFTSVLQECLAKVPARLRNVFMLREFDGLSREEICNSLELTPTHVGVMLHRCRIALRDCLQLNWHGETNRSAQVTSR